MRFLLAAVNAKYIHSNPAVYSLRAYAERFCSVLSREPASSDRAARAEIEIAEYTINQPFWEILADLYGKKPDAVGFSCYIWNRGMVFDLIRELSKVLPHVPVWLGGPEVSYDPEETLSALPSAAGVMIGEGEETFRELMKLYADELPSSFGTSSEAPDSPEETPAWPLPDQIRGIAYRTRPGGVVRRTPGRQAVPLDEIPFFYGEQNEINDFQDRIIYYESSRGCPYRCSYCLSSIDKTVRFRNVELVKKELQFFLDKKVPQVKFVDRTFNCSHAHAMEIWSYIREHDNGVTNFHFEIAADILTEEELALLRSLRPGLVQLEIGVQSTNQDTLKEIRRAADWERLKEIVGKIREGRNIHIHLDLIAGLPLEDMESFQHSFNDVYSCRPDQLQLGFLKVLKGSHMYEKAEEYGVMYTDFPPYEVLCTRWISYADILTLKRVEEMVELYYNSAQFTHTLPVLESCFLSPFGMYRALADFYDSRGLFRQSPSRMYRYQALLEFALQAAPEREEVWRQLLTLDLYLRENAKSRPDFAPPFRQEEEVKEKISRFYREEEKNPRFLAEYVQAGYDSRQMARMTHVECFSLPVWEAGMGAAEEKDGAARYFVLFDYRNRNPLNREARAVLLPL
ncbi:MAG TPA: B12-binding domain-containing radical SAM protein [Candidatus Eisenbergiella stercoravium]|nr:B12-binding domain-containing radical SAM protein [Candidatus Eisenbergiella stercoravium]